MEAVQWLTKEGFLAPVTDKEAKGRRGGQYRWSAKTKLYGVKTEAAS